MRTHAEVERVQAERRITAVARSVAIHQALKLGVTNREIADALHISIGRVWQLRDIAEDAS